MKLRFEPNLDYQHTAIESVCDLFRGQETCRTEFTVTRDALAAQPELRDSLGRPPTVRFRPEPGAAARIDRLTLF